MYVGFTNFQAALYCKMFASQYIVPCYIVTSLLNSKANTLHWFPGFVRARGGGDIRDVNLNSENWAVVKAALVAGMYPNVIHVDRDTCSISGVKEKKVRFHPTSVLSQPQYKKVRGKISTVSYFLTSWGPSRKAAKPPMFFVLFLLIGAKQQTCEATYYAHTAFHPAASPSTCPLQVGLLELTSRRSPMRNPPSRGFRMQQPTSTFPDGPMSPRSSSPFTGYPSQPI